MAQGDVIGQQDQPDGGKPLLSGRALRDVTDDNGDLALHVVAPGLIAQGNGIAGCQEAVRPALIHQGVCPKARRHIGGQGLSDQGHMVHIGRAIGPLIGPGQGAFCVMLMKANPGDGAMLQALRQAAQEGLAPIPVIEGSLQGRGEITGLHAPGKITGNHHEATITPPLQ